MTARMLDPNPENCHFIQLKQIIILIFSLWAHLAQADHMQKSHSRIAIESLQKD
jgi:hypothetical protein